MALTTIHVNVLDGLGLKVNFLDQHFKTHLNLSLLILLLAFADCDIRFGDGKETIMCVLHECFTSIPISANSTPLHMFRPRHSVSRDPPGSQHEI